MGQRANYIFREDNKLTIHYHHWRANKIVADLYLGEKKFLAFVQECRQIDEILDPIWIEGCVVIDRQLRQLYFWSLEIMWDTSVLHYYLSQLATKWPGWQVQFLSNRMYDVESVLGIDYVSQQEIYAPDEVSKDFIVNDKVEDWTNAVVIIKGADELFVTKTGDLIVEGIIAYGEEIIPLLKDKPVYELPREGDDSVLGNIVIDTVEKRLIISVSSFGLWEQCKDAWPGYSFIMGDYGYLELLQLGQIDTAGLELQMEQVIETFRQMTSSTDNFDPHEMAERLLKEDKNITFNPDFFDNVRPKTD